MERRGRFDYEERERYPEEEERRGREYPPSDWDRASRDMRRYTERESYGAEERERPWERELGEERGPGRFAGMGPKGYRRSDERIREDVCDRLMSHGEIDATDMEVAVHDGEVELTGLVGSRYEKRIAEDLVDSVPGVRDVRNRLYVSRRSQGGGFIAGPEQWSETGSWHGYGGRRR